jgi:hypothetical protein
VRAVRMVWARISYIGDACYLRGGSFSPSFRAPSWAHKTHAARMHFINLRALQPHTETPGGHR